MRVTHKPQSFGKGWGEDSKVRKMNSMLEYNWLMASVLSMIALWRDDLTALSNSGCMNSEPYHRKAFSSLYKSQPTKFIA